MTTRRNDARRRMSAVVTVLCVLATLSGLVLPTGSPATASEPTGVVEMEPYIRTSPDSQPIAADLYYTRWQFLRRDDATGTWQPVTDLVGFSTPYDQQGILVSDALAPGTYRVQYDHIYYTGVLQPMQRYMHFFGDSPDVVIVAGQTSSIGHVLLETDFYDQVAVYRFYSPSTGGHFYTADPAERDAVIARPSHDWNDEGFAYVAYSRPHPGTVPVYRFWSAQFRGHFFTVDENEKNNLLATFSSETWRYEGIAFHVYPPGSSQRLTNDVYRFWSPSRRHHFYTVSDWERNVVWSTLSDVWTYEGIAFRVPEA